MSRSPRNRPEGLRQHANQGSADLLALSSPLLILLALASMLYRNPSAHAQAIPALLIGCGLLVFSWWRRRRRRSMVLRLLRDRGPGKE